MDNLTPHVFILRKNLGTLSDKDQLFAKSLLTALDTWQSVSEKQAKWIKILAERATATAPATEKVAPDFAGVIELFHVASGHLKHPKIRLALPDGAAVVLSLAGPSSRTPGHVFLTDGAPYGNNFYYGNVAPDGTWTPGPKVGDNTRAAVKVLLRELADHPADIAALYGRRFGHCCFCGRELTDHRSVSVGYGPICAGHYQLPWGEADDAEPCEVPFTP